jgi:hypothetical protein
MRGDRCNRPWRNDMPKVKIERPCVDYQRKAAVDQAQAQLKR